MNRNPTSNMLSSFKTSIEQTLSPTKQKPKTKPVASLSLQALLDNLPDETVSSTFEGSSTSAVISILAGIPAQSMASVANEEDVTTLTSFPVFNNLPIEIKTFIMEQHIAQPRVAHMIATYVDQPYLLMTVVKFKISPDQAGIFHGINAQLRSIIQALALKTHRSLSESLLRIPENIFFINNIGPVIDYRLRSPLESRLGIKEQDIKNIALDVQWIATYKLRIDAATVDLTYRKPPSLALFLLMFPKLQKIYLILDTNHKGADGMVYEKFMSAVKGLTSVLGAAPLSGGEHLQKFVAYCVGSKMKGHLLEWLNCDIKYRQSVLDGSREEVKVEIVRWEVAFYGTRRCIC